MRKAFYLLLAATLFACSTQEEASDTDAPSPLPGGQDGQKYYTVSFDMQCEMTDFDMSQKPLSKAETKDTNDLYVVNVYYKRTDESSYHVYAYGTFDRKEKMTLTLMDGYLYKFKATLIKDARNVLRWKTDSTYYWSRGRLLSKLLNRFELAESIEKETYEASNNEIYLDDSGESYFRGKLDRYYGELEDYAPVENGAVAVDLYRVVWGVRFNITGLANGSLSFVMDYCPEITVSADSLYTPDEIFQLNNLYNAWSKAVNEEDYEEYVGLNIKWTSEDGSRTIELYDASMTINRLRKTIVNLGLKQSTPVQTDCDFVLESEEITDGQSYDVSGTIDGDGAEA